MMRERREQVTHVLELLMQLFSRVNMEDEWNMKVFDYITKAQRVMKVVEGKYRKEDDFRSLQHLSMFECGIRSGEMWETLMEQYSGSASMIDKHITVRDLRAKISQTSVAHLGSLNATHPPMQSYTHQIRARAGFNDLCPGDIGKMQILKETAQILAIARMRRSWRFVPCSPRS